MRFEGRELKPYSEPVSVGELIEGQVYFSVTFFDDEMLIPNIEPIVFIEKKLKNEIKFIYSFKMLIHTKPEPELS